MAATAAVAIRVAATRAAAILLLTALLPALATAAVAAQAPVPAAPATATTIASAAQPVSAVSRFPALPLAEKPATEKRRLKKRRVLRIEILPYKKRLRFFSGVFFTMLFWQICFDAFDRFLDIAAWAGKVDADKSAAFRSEEGAAVEHQVAFFFKEGGELLVGHVQGVAIDPAEVGSFWAVDLQRGAADDLLAEVVHVALDVGVELV